MRQPQQDTEMDLDRSDPGRGQAMLAAFSAAWISTPQADNTVRAPVPAETGPALDRLFAAGRLQWPELMVAPEALAIHLAHHIAADTVDLPGALAAISGADLYLALACAAAAPGALQAFDRACATAINGTIAGIDPSPAFRTEVRQLLHERLFVGSVDDPPRIGSYAGRGPLAAWVAIVTQRLALLMRRTDRNRARIEDRAAGEPLAPVDDPELAYLRLRYRDDFRAAYLAALESLPERDRTLLRVPPSISSNRFWITRGDSTFPPPESATRIACSRSSGVASLSM